MQLKSVGEPGVSWRMPNSKMLTVAIN